MKIINGEGQIIQYQKIKGAIYRVVFLNADKKSYINFAIDDGSKINVSIPINNIKNSTTDDKINSDFLNYQKNILSRNEKITLLNNFIDQYPQSIIALFSKVELLSLNEVPNEDSALIDFQKRYFNSIDLNDKLLQILPNIFNKLYDFVSLRPINVQNYIESENILLSKLNCNDDNFAFYIDWFVKNIYYYNKYQLIDAYNYLVNEYLVKNYCYDKQKDLYKKVTDFRVKLEEIQIGTTLPDFKLKIFENQNETTFYDLIKNKKYSFLVFYDPDCSHCKETVPIVANDLKNVIQSNPNFQVINMVNANPTKAEIQDFIETAKLQPYINCEINEDIIEFRKLTKIHGNPNFLLVNEFGKIIMKGNNINEVINEITH